MVVLVGNADYAIVEAEADKVAKQAADHLRRAKKRLRSRNDDYRELVFLIKTMLRCVYKTGNAY